MRSAVSQAPREGRREKANSVRGDDINLDHLDNQKARAKCFRQGENVTVQMSSGWQRAWRRRTPTQSKVFQTSHPHRDIFNRPRRRKDCQQIHWCRQTRYVGTRLRHDCQHCQW